MIAMLRRLTKVLSSALVNFGAIGLLVMTAIVGWQVFGRYVLNASPDWSEQAALTLMIWYVSFAAAAGVREGFHIRITTLETALPARAQPWFRAFGDLVVAICGVAMAVYGADLVAQTWQHRIPTLGLPRGLAYMGLPIAGALIALFAFERVLEEFSPETPDDEVDPRWS